ncbi:MAG: tRNA (adenosine(37)-N6)-threonylcarbamoyltransferase complex ATPase subunit type 1 TsaE [Hyphomicrobium sp.]|jgi:hypothetical protein
MPGTWLVADADEAGVGRLAERLALKLARGDCVALFGDLGAGKTTFARAVIRAVLADEHAEVPSPTFSIVQTYESDRLEIAHLDLYRLASEDETGELGLDDYARRGALLIEWPERAPRLLGDNRLEIHLDESSLSDSHRTVRMEAFGSWQPRLERLESMSAFLAGHPPWHEASSRYLQGDASARAYARLATRDRRGVLMDQPRQPDGPALRNGLPYSRIAHLAEDVRPFVAIANALSAAGLSAPEIYASDMQAGFLIIEDFGERVFGREMLSGTSQPELWHAATDTLLALAHVPVPQSIPLPDGTAHTIPEQDKGVLEIELELLPDWYWPALKGSAIPPDARAEFMELWRAVFGRVLQGPKGWVLRDYHSPNLMWLPAREGPRRTGLLDFQDAMRGSPAYDLVSVLEDARVDVAPALEDGLLDYYCRERRSDPSFDSNEFQFAYAALGAQRNTRSWESSPA